MSPYPPLKTKDVSYNNGNRQKPSDHDVLDMIGLYYQETGRILAKTELKRDLEECPWVIAKCGEAIIGFATTGEFSPDVLRLDNLFVRNDCRNQKIGFEMLNLLETIAPKRFRYIILDNSRLYEYPSGGIVDKKPAVDFYMKKYFNQADNSKFERAFETGETYVLFKKLPNGSKVPEPWR